MSFRLPTFALPETESSNCYTITEALDQVFEQPRFAQIAEETRRQFREKVESIEGSNPKVAITCISEEDLERVGERIELEIQADNLSRGSYPVDNPSLQGFLRGMNRHCDECLRQDCMDRVNLTRQQIKERSGMGSQHLNSRKAKASHSMRAQAKSSVRASDRPSYVDEL